MSFSNMLLFVNSFKIFGFDIYFYAIAIVSGMALCAIVAVPLFKKRGFKGDIVLDVMIAIIPCAIIGARVCYVIFEFPTYIRASFWESIVAMVSIRDGGLAIYGGVAGGALGMFIVSKVRKVSMGKLADVGATMLPLGQAVGRLGNFFNQEVYGKATEITWWPYSVLIEETGQYHLALCFYEMFLNILLFAVLYFFLFKYNGRRNLYSLGGYFIGYGIIRAVLEPLRMPEFQLPFFDTGLLAMVIVSICIIIAGLTIVGVLLYKDITEKNYWWRELFKKKASEPPKVEDNTDV